MSSRTSPSSCLYSLATVPARYPTTQPQACRFLSQVASAVGPDHQAARHLRNIDRIASRSGVETRYSVLADFSQSDPRTFEFFPKNWALDPFPTTSARMKRYERESVDLAASAATRALAAAGIEPGRVTHLVITTCTGFFAPGPDVALVQRLGLRATTERTIIGFMGCYAGFTGLRAADWIVRADPDAVVLMISVELCSLHFQKDFDLSSLVVGCLFGDGAAAAVFARQGRFEGGLGELAGSRSALHPDSIDQMSWRVGDHGFVMTLDAEVPATLGAETEPFVQALLALHGARREDVRGWAIHGGGPKIIDAIRDSLAIGEDDVASSRAVLRQFGNMSSATILFVLEKELERARARDGGDVVLLGFGPGLTMEGAILRC